MTTLEKSGIRREAEGKYDRVAGKVKEEVGEATGDRSLEAKGRLQGAKGKVKDAVGDIQQDLE